MASSTEDTSPKQPKFRSVLPHEPQPTDEEFGFLHVQGAFCPKIRQCHGIGEKTDTEEQKQQQQHVEEQPFWTKESLEDALSSCLGSKERANALGLPFPASQIQLLDAIISPFTKVRLKYDCPVQAFHVLLAFRRLKLTPNIILGDHSVKDDAYTTITFSSRPLQVTQITTRTLPEPGDGACWPRASPPKFRRLIESKPGEDPALLREERAKTRFIFCSNLLHDDEETDNEIPPFWTDAHCVAEAVRAVVQPYDSSSDGMGGPEVFVLNKKIAKYCHIGMRSPADARAVMTALQDKVVQWTWTDEAGQQHSVQSGRLFLDHAAITQRSMALALARREGKDVPKGDVPHSECTSVTAHETVPGLTIIPEFVSEQEEAALMAVLNGPHTPWAPAQSTPTEGGIVKRRVQHYGYVFDYKTADVLRDRTEAGADCPPMPKISKRHAQDEAGIENYIMESLEQGHGWDVLAGVTERIRRRKFETPQGDIKRFPNTNQLTVNHYAPGEGIGSHIDTPSAFGEGLISISLNSGIVMEFRKVCTKGKDKRRKLVYLPPRSLVLMAGDARYEWEHMIVNRMTDTHNGEVLPRKLRISLTFRTALDLSGDSMPLVESKDYPPVWGDLSLTSSLKTPDCERDHVHKVYDSIATQWHHTRGRRGVLWPGATQFLRRLSFGSVVADVGCGDGKYFPAIWEAGSYVIGTDISLPLLQTAKLPEANIDAVPESRRVSEHRRHLRKRPAVAVADCMNVPMRTNSCDAAICIAVMHHLSTENRRRRCIEELARIVKPGGLINVQAWAITQEEGSRRTFAASDVFVPFNAQPKHLKLGESEQNGRHTTFDDENVADIQSAAEVYSKALNAEYDEQKGLVVFQRYCHMYRKGELEKIASTISNVELVESGFESGNYFIILKAL